MKVAELVLNIAFQVDQKVYRYDAEGNLAGMARVPLADQYVSVPQSIAVSPEGEVYALITHPNGAEIQKLTFISELQPILTPPALDQDREQQPPSSRSLENCRSREEIIGVALDYLNNSVYLNSYHINDNPACSSRVKPHYLGQPGSYTSVPYSWEKWDTVEDFNAYMSGGNNGYFAGDIDNPTSGCS